MFSTTDICKVVLVNKFGTKVNDCTYNVHEPSLTGSMQI